MKKISTVLVVATLVACTQQRPNIRASDSSIDGVPRLARPHTCDEGAFGTPLPGESLQNTYAGSVGNRQLGGLAAVLVSSLITQGVDFLGDRLKAGGEERTRTLEAALNFSGNTKVGCFDLVRGNMRFRIAMIPVNGTINGHTQPNSHVYFSVVGISYPESINLDRSGVRGLSLTFEITRPGSETAVSQTVSLRNVEVGARVPSIELNGNPFTSGYIVNPFLTFDQPEDARPIAALNLPFTLRVRLTEVRNANELSRFASGVVANANDDLTAALIRAAGIRDDEDEDGDEDGAAGNTQGPQEEAPPGTAGNDQEPDDD